MARPPSAQRLLQLRYVTSNSAAAKRACASPRPIRTDAAYRAYPQLQSWASLSRRPLVPKIVCIFEERRAPQPAEYPLKFSDDTSDRVQIRRPHPDEHGEVECHVALR